MKETKTEMVPVPLPTEVPPPPLLDQIPPEILHSATVEMLIQQNEDLSSRLKVNIRRNSQLEQKILSLEKEMQELNRKRENVLAQMDLIKEKEKIWKGNKESIERQNESLRKEADLLELRYNELYSTSQQKEKQRRQEAVEKQEQIKTLQRKLDILQKVRARAKEKLRQLLLEMAQGMHRSHKNVQQSESSNRLLKRSFTELKNEIIEKENFFKEQLEQLKRASKNSLLQMDARISQLKEQNQGLQQQQKELKGERDQLAHQLHEERKGRHRIKRLSEELNELKNERVRIKREMQNQNERLQDRELNRNEEIRKLRNEVQSLHQQKQDSEETLSSAEQKILKLAKDNSELSIQLESMQKLWMEAQSQLEKQELRSQTLEKINRQLSQQKQEEKVDRAIATAHPVALEKDDKDPFQKKIQSVFASQYRTLDKPPEIDI